MACRSKILDTLSIRIFLKCVLWRMRSTSQNYDTRRKLCPRKVRRQLSQEKHKVRARIIGRYLWQWGLENWIVAASFFTAIKTGWVPKPETRIGASKSRWAELQPSLCYSVFIYSSVLIIWKGKEAKFSTTTKKLEDVRGIICNCYFHLLKCSTTLLVNLLITYHNFYGMLNKTTYSLWFRKASSSLWPKT